MPHLFLPTTMRHLVGGAEMVAVAGDTLGAAIEDAERQFPGVRAALLPDGNHLKAGLAAVCGESPARYGLRERVSADTEIHFVPAISGGAHTAN